MTTSTTTTKITKRDNFNALLALDAVKSNQTLVDFINHEIELLDKKSATAKTGERKPTARQKENEAFKSAIIANMEENMIYSIDDMLKNFDCFGDEMTHNRLAQILVKMAKDDQIIRLEDKKKIYYQLPKAE